MDLKAVLEKHRLWVECNPTGVRADLRGADLRGASLRWANLREADLSEANLRGADLREADLRGASLRWANLREADLREANLPSPTLLLLANWGRVSGDLTIELMRYDCDNHPGGTPAFDTWADTGECPYEGCHVQRAANFKERRNLWSPGPAKSAYELMCMLLEEKCTWTSENI